MDIDRILRADAEALQAKPHVPRVLLERQEQDASPLRGEAQERAALGHGSRWLYSNR